MLNVSITSFSYRRGYPRVEDEHGGGFVFDCRSISNPGRDPQFKHKTGLDTGVIQYLEKFSGTESFYSAVRSLVLAAVEKFIERGFTSLHVAFGCTGGQHRSVYFSERLAAELRGLPGLNVVVLHRETSYWDRS